MEDALDFLRSRAIDWYGQDMADTEEAFSMRAGQVRQVVAEIERLQEELREARAVAFKAAYFNGHAEVEAAARAFLAKSQ